MLLGIKMERKPSPYIINPKYSGEAAVIQEIKGNFIHSMRWGPEVTISRQVCAVTEIRMRSFIHSTNVPCAATLCELRADPEGNYSP